jgi:hypothetical protein
MQELASTKRTMAANVSPAKAMGQRRRVANIQRPERFFLLTAGAPAQAVAQHVCNECSGTGKGSVQSR